MKVGQVVMPQNDEELVELVVRGDTQAFGRLYDRYAPIVRSVCFEAIGNVTDSQDLAQDVFLNAFRQLATLNDPTRFGAWIIGIARLSGRQWRRTRARDRHRWVGGALDKIGKSDDAGASNEQWVELHAALGELVEKERMAVHLFYLDEEAAELARKLLGLSTSGFYRLLERSREKLRQRLLKSEELRP
jgi:RNA polymerase sigma-70 factor, ECF subfamily